MFKTLAVLTILTHIGAHEVQPMQDHMQPPTAPPVEIPQPKPAPACGFSIWLTIKPGPSAPLMAVRELARGLAFLEARDRAEESDWNYDPPWFVKMRPTECAGEVRA